MGALIVHPTRPESRCTQAGRLRLRRHRAGAGTVLELPFHNKKSTWQDPESPPGRRPVGIRGSRVGIGPRLGESDRDNFGVGTRHGEHVSGPLALHRASDSGSDCRPLALAVSGTGRTGKAASGVAGKQSSPEDDPSHAGRSAHTGRASAPNRNSEVRISASARCCQCSWRPKSWMCPNARPVALCTAVGTRRGRGRLAHDGALSPAPTSRT